MLASGDSFLSHLHGRDNSWIGPAAANVALQGASDLGFAWVRSLLQQAYAGQDHSGRAVAALHGVGLDEGLLQRMEAAVLRQTFDGGDLFSFDFRDGCNAGAHGRAIDEHGAGSAMAFATAILAAGEFQLVAEDPEQEAVGVQLEPVMRLIDDEFHALILRPAMARRSHECERGTQECVRHAITFDCRIYQA